MIEMIGLFVLLASLSCRDAFQIVSKGYLNRTNRRDFPKATPNETTTTPTSRIANNSKQDLGLLTFDLDDTLFPIRPVVKDANEAQMKYINEKTGGEFTVADFIATTKRIRAELVKVASPQEGNEPISTMITYTELRKRAIRTLLGSNEYVDAAFDVWLTERQASANRNLYPDAISTLATLRSRYPDIPFVAITNGRGDPRDMPNIRHYFDDCISGEDTNVRKPDPRIYERALKQANFQPGSGSLKWVHVGDCLANDVGASASCGAYAVWLERAALGVAEWSTATKRDEMERQQLQDEAKEKIAVKIQELSELPAVVDELLGSALVSTRN